VPDFLIIPCLALLCLASLPPVSHPVFLNHYFCFRYGFSLFLLVYYLFVFVSATRNNNSFLFLCESVLLDDSLLKKVIRN
jgi:hypothetical protein